MDIAKCANENCLIKKECHRFTAESRSSWQSYAQFEFEIIDGKPFCDSFWANEKARNETINRHSKLSELKETKSK